MVTQEDPDTAEEIEATVNDILRDASSVTACGEVLEQFIVVRDGGDFGVELTPRDRANATEYANVLEQYCNQRTPEAARAFVDLLEQRKARSCKIGVLPFDLTFNWNNASQRWETVSAPEGGCGIVTMSFLEKDKEYSYFWNYREQTIVTNKTGNDPIRGNCAAWPQEEQFYRWQPDTLNRSCEYVSFGF